MNQQQLEQALKHAVDVKCESCGHTNFKKELKIKKISKLVAMTPEDVYLPIPVIVCSKCGAEFNDESGSSNLTV